MNAHRQAVVNRSNSRNCGEIDDERGDENPGQFALEDCLGAFLVRRVEVGEQKADRDRFDLLRFQGARGRKHAGFVERLKLFAARRNEPAL